MPYCAWRPRMRMTDSAWRLLSYLVRTPPVDELPRQDHATNDSPILSALNHMLRNPTERSVSVGRRAYRAFVLGYLSWSLVSRVTKFLCGFHLGSPRF